MSDNEMQESLGNALRGDGGFTPRANPHIHENLIVQIECQVEHWNRMAVRHPNPDEAHRLWQRAEGLQYALRILYAFKPEFDELVHAAARPAG